MPNIVTVATQTKVPYVALSNVAQVNDLLTAYTGNETAVAGLNAIKEAMIATVPNAANCPQCAATGKITSNAVEYVCPLCSGMTKTDGTYTASTSVVAYVKP